MEPVYTYKLQNIARSLKPTNYINHIVLFLLFTTPRHLYRYFTDHTSEYRIQKDRPKKKCTGKLAAQPISRLWNGWLRTMKCVFPFPRPRNRFSFRTRSVGTRHRRCGDEEGGRKTRRSERFVLVIKGFVHNKRSASSRTRPKRSLIDFLPPKRISTISKLLFFFPP